MSLSPASDGPQIRHAASCGIDYISTDYPAILTRSGLVLALNSQENRSEDHVPDGPCVPSPAKKQRLDPATTPSVNLALDSVNILNLWDPIYARDASPVVPLPLPSPPPPILICR
jgi:hypothetical protein